MEALSSVVSMNFLASKPVDSAQLKVHICKVRLNFQNSFND